MNDVEPRLRDLGERAKDEIGAGVTPRREHLRRIRRRRLVVSTSAFACAATLAAAGAFAWAARTPEHPRVRPAQEGPSFEEQVECLEVPFVPGWVPERFGTRPQLGRDKTRPGVVQSFHGRGPDAIEVVAHPGTTAQFRPEWVEVLGGRASLGRTLEGWSVELHAGGCEFVLNGYGVSKGELERFATALRPPPRFTTMPFRGTIWPPDDLDDASHECTVDMHDRDDAVAVAEDFLRAELGWEDPIVVRPRHPGDSWFGTVAAADAYETAPGIELEMTEVQPRCWSVEAVGRFAGRRVPEGLEVTVDGSEVVLSYQPANAAKATAVVRYGPRTVRKVVDVRAYGGARVDLGFRPRGPGSILVLLEDEEGFVFTAVGTALPPATPPTNP